MLKKQKLWRIWKFSKTYSWWRGSELNSKGRYAHPRITRDIYSSVLGSGFTQIFLPLRSRKTSYIPNVIRNTIYFSKIKKEVISVLKNFWCIFCRQWKWSHEIRYYPATKTTFVLVFHGNKPMREWTLRSILEESWISEKFLKNINFPYLSYSLLYLLFHHLGICTSSAHLHHLSGNESKWFHISCL